MPTRTRRTTASKPKPKSGARKGPRSASARSQPAPSRPAKRAGAKPHQEDLHTITNLEQLRVLSDPLRLRIMEHLCEAEYTTKQVAGLLGEKPTKLYHHVDALEKVGLIRLSRTRQNRGTLEKYYIAVARSFTAESTLFRSNTEGGEEAAESLVTTVLQRTGAELKALAGLSKEEKEDPRNQMLLSFIEIAGSGVELDKVRRRIHRLMEDLRKQATAEVGDKPGDKPERRYRLTLAFYPLDRGNEN